MGVIVCLIACLSITLKSLCLRKYLALAGPDSSCSFAAPLLTSLGSAVGRQRTTPAQHPEPL